MESLGYVWSHLYTGKLPWAGMTSDKDTFSDPSEAKNDLLKRQVKRREKLISQDFTYVNDEGGSKTNSTSHHMLPPVLKEYMAKVRDLDKDVRPGEETVMCDGVDFDGHSIKRLDADNQSEPLCCAQPDYEGYQQMIQDYAANKGIDLEDGFVKETAAEDGSTRYELKCD